MAHDPYALSDEDRLPWLEPVDAEDEPEREVPGGLIGWALAALAVLGLVVGGVWWWQNREVTPSGTGELIAAPNTPYKVKAEEVGGMKIEGEGELAFATSQGAQVQGSLDLSAVPETPVARTPEPKAEAPKSSASASVAEGGKLEAKAPPAPIEAEGPAGATIQLGAFPSQNVARETWASMEERFSYLAERSEAIIRAEVNGRTYYRLRVATGSAAEAKDVCARLRVAGENCLVVQ